MSDSDRRAAPPVRVLLAAPTFGAFGGMEAFVLNLADSLREEARLSVRVCFKRTRQFHLRKELDVACRGLAVTFCERASATLWDAVGWADVVHAQNASPDIVGLAALRRRPVAMTLHNTLPRGPLARRASWRAAAAIAETRWYVSEFVWDSWEPRRRRSTSSRVPPVPRLHEAFVEPAARRGFVFVGRMVPGKGADLLIDAYRSAGLDPQSWPLTILGDGPERAALEARLQRRSDRGISLAGFVQGADKSRTIAAARWMVVPSHWGEPFGMAAIEARYAGVPCVVTNDGGLPEAAGRHALVCDAGSVPALTAALRRAAAMSDAEYRRRAQGTRVDLAHELPEPCFYVDAFLRLAGGRRPDPPPLLPTGAS